MNDAHDDPRRQVLRLLREHAATDEKEAADVSAIEAFVGAQENIFGKTNPLGHITGSALVVDPDGRLLLTFHRKLNRWLQLGGHSEPTEFDPAETAMREAREESGLCDLVFHPRFGARPIDIDVHTIPARRDEPAHDHLDFRYVVLTQVLDEVVCSSESKALRWVAIDDLTPYGFDPALTRAVQKLRRGLRSE